MRISGIVAAAALSLLSFHAQADTAKAWTAAKAGLPGDAKLVVGVDVAAIQKTQLFATFYPKLRDKPEITETLTILKDACKLDPLTVIQGAVIALTSDQEDGAVYVALANFDRAKLASCLSRAHQAKKDDASYSLKQDGNITQITKGDESTFLGWIGKDVLVVSLHAQDKPSLVKWMGGKGGLARSTLGKALTKVNTSAALWGAGDGDKELQPGVTAKQVYGAVTYTGGALDADVHAVLPSAADAAAFATTATKQIGEAAQGGAGVPPAVLAMVKAVKISSANDEVVVKAHIVEQDLLGVIAMAIGGNAGNP
jgi:hypothetical protein